MPKYYITCGSYEFLTAGPDASSAALWTLHQYLDNRIDLDSVDWSDPTSIDRQDLVCAMVELDEQLLVSEQGFGLADAGYFDTAELLTEWNQLILALRKLESLGRLS